MGVGARGGLAVAGPVRLWVIRLLPVTDFLFAFFVGRMSISMGQDSNPPVPATPPCPAASPSCAQHAGPGPAVYRAPPRPATPGCLAAYSHSRRPEAGLGRLPQRDHWGVPRAGEGPSGVALVGSHGGRRAPHRLRATLPYSPTPGRAMGERASRGRLAQQWGCPPKPFQDKYGRESRGRKKIGHKKKGNATRSCLHFRRRPRGGLGASPIKGVVTAPA